MKEIVQNSLVWIYVNFELWPPENSDPTEIRETINIAANLNAIPLIYKELWRHILIFIVTASRVDIFQKLPFSEYQVTKLELIAQNHNKIKVLWFLRLTVKRQKITGSPNKLWRDTLCLPSPKIYLFLFEVTLIMGYSRKNPNRGGGWGYAFLKNP